MSRDLDLLKTVVDSEDWSNPADEAIHSILALLHNEAATWNNIYDAIKDAYAGNADWGDEDA